MTTNVIRVPERVQQEVQVASRVTGWSVGELVEKAWGHFKETPQFEAELRSAQEALAAGNIERVTDLVLEQAARYKVQSIRDARNNPL